MENNRYIIYTGNESSRNFSYIDCVAPASDLPGDKCHSRIWYIAGTSKVDVDRIGAAETQTTLYFLRALQPRLSSPGAGVRLGCTCHQGSCTAPGATALGRGALGEATGVVGVPFFSFIPRLLWLPLGCDTCPRELKNSPTECL